MDSGGPSAITRPAAMTTTQSLMSRTTSMSCSTKITVMPSSRRSLTWPSRLWVRAGFTPAIGSSSMTTLGSLMSARAISSSLRWPPESVPAKSSFFRSSLNRVSRSIAFSVLARSWARQVPGTRARKKLSPFCPCAPSSMFCSTVSRDSALVSWKVRTTPSRATWSGASFPSERSSKDQVPVLGWSKPVSRLNSVVLPAPLGPIRPVMPPRWISRWSTDTAVSPPNERVTLSTTTAGSGFATPTSQGSPRRAAWASRRGACCAGAPADIAWAPVVGDGSAGIEHHLSSVTEDALRPEDQQCHQSDTDQHEAQRRDIGRAEQRLRDDPVADEGLEAGVGELDQEHEDHAADDGPQDSGRAAQDERGVGEEGVCVLVLVGVHRPESQRVHRAAEGADHTAQDQRLHLVGVDVLAQRTRGVLVLADRLDHPAPRAADQRPDEQAAQGHDDPADEREPELRAAPVHAQEVVPAVAGPWRQGDEALVEARQAASTAGDRGRADRTEHQPQDLSGSDRHDRQVVGAQPQGRDTQ